ncbi:Os01g0153900 [Oryza sativa Japonica Group]|uniref:Os01g0153900 protein n=1 Tax=Oryza sativa subsp. japonica TaxID=39947 RepID=A0A0P0UYI1_ORYSJ|nr:Os01g0153900 [Oryza sativa Japonica Group]
MASETTSQKASSDLMSMTLLIDTKAQRVLYAEARKDVVDFLLSLLALPIASGIKLLGKGSMVGCVGNLYASFEKLDDAFVQADTAKDSLLSPVVLSPAASSNTSVLRLPAPSSAQSSKSFFRCSYSSNACRSFVTNASGTKCPNCGNQMATACTYVAGGQDQNTQNAAAEGAKGGGFVQGIVTYTVMDDLTVAPMSSISSITLLNRFAVKDLGALKEKTVQLGYTEVITFVTVHMTLLDCWNLISVGFRRYACIC